MCLRAPKTTNGHYANTGEDRMIADKWVVSRSAALLLLIESGATISAAPMASAAPGNAQITVLYDAFGKTSTMQKDWGYAALVEYGGQRILFDTGNSPEILAQNAKAKGVDLTKLDFVVMSHRHGDHMGGLTYLLKVNPRSRSTHLKRDSGFTVPTYRAVFIARTHLSLRNSATTTARRQKLCDLDPLGPEQTFNLSTRTPRLLPISI